MGLTVTMAFNGMADFEDNGVLKVAGAAWEVRRAGLSDVAAILSVERHSGRRPVDLPVMEAAVVDPARHVVVASLDGSVIGWAKTHHWEYPDGPAPSGHYLGGISVLPAWRRLGVGTVLTEARMRWIWTRAADAWYVVSPGNVPSIELHRRWNFSEVARSPTFHTTTFPGDPGILLRAQRQEPQRHVGGAPTGGDGTGGDGTGGAPQLAPPRVTPAQLAAAGSVLDSGPMLGSSSPLTVRRAIVSGPDSGPVGRLVGAYLRQTEREKAVHLQLRPVGQDPELPARYRAEADHPESAFGNASVYLAEIDAGAVGVAIARNDGAATEIKRLWADPHVRGRGIGSALLDAVLQDSRGVVRLSVWDWRMQAKRLYESRGFVRVPSWDARPRLVCMERSAVEPRP